MAAPEVSAPDVSAPDVSAPDVSAPDVSAPDVSAPGALPPTQAGGGGNAGAPPAPPGGDGEPLRPPASYSMRPAMIVAGLAVLIVGVFVTVGFLSTGPVQSTDTSTAPRVISGTPLRAVPAARVLSVITQDDQPPANILNSVSIPEGAVRVSHQDNSAASDQYDEQVGMVSDASQGALR